MEIIEANKVFKEMHKFCSYKMRSFLTYDDVTELTDIILEQPLDQMGDFIMSVIDSDDSNTKAVNFIQQLSSMRKKHIGLVDSQKKTRVDLSMHAPEGMQVYRKNTEDVLPGMKKKKSQQKKKAEKKQRKLQTKKENEVFVRQYCDCQARVHPLINNCLKCGKIICSQEGEGPCMFCGSAKQSDSSSETKKARDHRDKLIGYGNNARITRVYDDQSDHFDFQGNQWLSETEKQIMKKRQEDTDKRMKEEQRKIVVTFDLAGRRIIEHIQEPQKEVDLECNEEVDQILCKEEEEVEGTLDVQAEKMEEGEELNLIGNSFPELKKSYANQEIDMMDPYSIEETQRKAGSFVNPFLQSRPAFRKVNNERPDNFFQNEGIQTKSESNRELIPSPCQTIPCKPSHKPKNKQKR